MRQAMALLAGLASVVGGIYLYPVGGRIWSAAQVSGVARVEGGRLAELTDRDAVPHAAREAVQAARLDRFRRLVPGLPSAQCVPLEIALRTGNEWVNVPLRCTSGLLFDSISPAAWR